MLNVLRNTILLIFLEVFDEIKAWPFEEAKRILSKIGGKTPDKGYVLFETGYGPSGLPHIGTFGEVVRTCFVINAFKQIAPHIPTKLMCISDDFDGLRKVPTNIPNQEMVAKYIGHPLTSIPDPFETDVSFGWHMNNRLKGFLNSFGFEYEFVSATEQYKIGAFDAILLRVVEKYDELMELMLSNLGEERQGTYSPLMPLCPKTGKILASGVKGVNKTNGTVVYVNEFGEEIEQEVTGGKCKLQWKIDFGGRWAGLGVDYEIFGKEHGANEKLYKQICKILGGNPPETFCYELFLGEDGAKISKSKGNGISVEEWLKYAPSESISLFMYQKPKTAKKLHFDVIPKCADEYISFASKYHTQSDAEKFENPVYHIHFGRVPNFDLGAINYSLLLNLVSACNPDSEDILWGFIQKYDANLTKGKYEFLDKLVTTSISYYNDFVKPHKQFRAPTEAEKSALLQLKDMLSGCLTSDDFQHTPESIQNSVYQIGKDCGFDLKDWFSCIYQVLLGQNQGPRVGSFIALYGIANTIALIEEKL